MFQSYCVGGLTAEFFGEVRFLGGILYDCTVELNVHSV